MNINFMGIAITGEDIVKVIRFIKEKRDKDKNFICLQLALADENIQGWYGHFNHVFSKVLGHAAANEKLDGATMAEIYKFISREEAILAADDCVKYFKDLFKENTARKVEGVDRTDLSALINKIDLFQDAAKHKLKWVAESGTKFEAPPSDIWPILQSLRTYSQDIHELTRNMRNKIGCDANSLRDLYLKTKREAA